MLEVQFIKMHGLGNDFVFIEKKALTHSLNTNFIKEISHRKTGIGCDQLIFYSMLSSKRCLMEIHNSDGSLAKMCGNATRCLALNIFHKYQESMVEIIIDNKVLATKILSNNLVEVNMGPVDFSPKWLPKANVFVEIAQNYGLKLKEIICVDLGNPHVVIFCDYLSDSDQHFIGQSLQKTFEGLQGINVNFATLQDNEITLRVWERGVGFTMACGSGACASFAAAKKLKFIGNTAIIKFKFGNLFMSFLDQDIIMSGSANKIVEGLYYYHV